VKVYILEDVTIYILGECEDLYIGDVKIYILEDVKMYILGECENLYIGLYEDL